MVKAPSESISFAGFQECREELCGGVRAEFDLSLGKIILITTVDTALYGMKIAFAVWLGFVYERAIDLCFICEKPFKLYVIDTGYQLICYLVMGSDFGGLAALILRTAATGPFRRSTLQFV
jgi:hypothetical protein